LSKKYREKMADQIENSGLLDFFLERTSNLYDAEKKFMKCFVALSISAFEDELRTALDAPSTEAELHITRLEQILMSLNKEAAGTACEVVAALAEKSNKLIKNNEPGTAMRDAAIIYAAQMIEHYKIASYEILQQIAVELELEPAAVLLQQCLEDEKNTSAYLSRIAKNITNPAARTKV
jgi:ferritin-like metal-binding protein YciE